LIAQFLGGVEREAFRDNEEKQWAVVSQLLILGEAVKGLSQDLRGQNPEVPWSEIARMRDKVIHHYWEIDWEEVWMAATVGVPELQAVVDRLLVIERGDSGE